MSVLLLPVLTPAASAASCKNFVREAQVAFAKEVILLRAYELEAADRLKGLDSRPFAYMRDEAKKAAATIADEGKLKDEEALARCATPTRPVRKICAGSAQNHSADVAYSIAVAAFRGRQG